MVMMSPSCKFLVVDEDCVGASVNRSCLLLNPLPISLRQEVLVGCRLLALEIWEVFIRVFVSAIFSSSFPLHNVIVKGCILISLSKMFAFLASKTLE